MMILRKPLSILTAILFLTSPMILSANETTDTLQVASQAEEALILYEAHGGESKIEKKKLFMITCNTIFKMIITSISFQMLQKVSIMDFHFRLF